jgi:hypothetical protein
MTGCVPVKQEEVVLDIVQTLKDCAFQRVFSFFDEFEHE